MGTDDIEDNNSSMENPSETQPSTTDPDKGARVDAAKAFFRAMYAGEETPAVENPEPGLQSQECKNCERLNYALNESEQKAAEIETLYKRMAADFENYRRRMERDREESVTLGVKKAAEGLIPALDDLDRALSFLTADTPAEKLIESFQLVANRMLSCLESLGLKRMKTIGEMFDPKFHEPVQQVETTEHADGTIVTELRHGYTLNDKVVRPALVNVASNNSGSQSGGGEGDGAAQTESSQNTLQDKEISTADDNALKVYDLEEFGA